MSNQPIDAVYESAVRKRDMLSFEPLKFFMGASLAGMYVGLAVIFSFTVANVFQSSGSAATALLGGITFSIALLMIIIGKAELFTGNTLYLSMSTLAGKTSLKDLIFNWGATYVGNLLGVLFFTLLFVLAGNFAEISSDHFLIQIATKKSNLTVTELFFRGILCNWLICLAIWLPLHVKENGAKITLIIFLVTAFFVSGYEHSIANMAIFSIALASPHPDTVTLAGAINNIIPVTFGNIVGGAVFVGAVYYYLNKKVKKKEAFHIIQHANTQEETVYHD
ncbi:formate/nitrite transporter family protein [Bacillus kwashiorkori]|uniref:formate/nitrite transporter family protein n=1 Tax=Bacillus kwashiorkori TaxID=1522318 RepID=UPI000784109B|nr:formate/nitrite transporter family protein [Bacillus kwashiorkori]